MTEEEATTILIGPGYRPFHYGHDIHPLNGYRVGFVYRRINSHVIQRIGTFQIQEQYWDDFRHLNSSVATFAWEFS
jgi:hypothetical protein